MESSYPLVGAREADKNLDFEADVGETRVQPPAPKKARADAEVPHSHIKEAKSVKTVVWKARGELLTLPWPTKLEGIVLLLGVGDESASAIFALLSLGLMAIAIISDPSQAMAKCIQEKLSNVVIVSDNRFTKDLLTPIFERRQFSCCFIGSKLFETSATTLDIVKDLYKGPLLMWDVQEYSSGNKISDSNGLAVCTYTFGYLDTYVWCKGSAGSRNLVDILGDTKLDDIDIWSMESDSSTFVADWKGKKPVPPRVVLEGNFLMQPSPETIMKSGTGDEAFYVYLYVHCV